MNARAFASIGALLFLGCASVKPTQSRREVAELVDARAGIDAAIPAREDEESRARVRERVDALLGTPLSLDRALRLALLNNRELQGTLEDLGVAQADLVQAGLLENPVVAGDLVFSTAGYGLGGGMSLSQSLLSAFLIPAKRRLAKRQLAHAVVTVGHAALELVHDVKVAYVTVQAAEAALELQRTLTQAAEVADELAARQLEAGNVSALDRELFAASLDEARVQLADAQIAVTTAREDLTRLLGLWGEDARWKLEAPLPAETPPPAALEELETEGVRNRLDLSAARFAVESLQQAVKLRRRGLVPQVEAGLEARNEVGTDAGHEWVLGPSLAIELPIFDPGHADLARLDAYLRQAQHRLQAAAVEARSEIRVHREELVAAHRKVDYYRRTVLPRAQDIQDLTLRHYNAMLVGTYQLLETRADQIAVERAHVEAVRDYWIARADLELATGGNLPDVAARP
jgi:cobalt-zinc-cadmium efflux system outer membrane protein